MGFRAGCLSHAMRCGSIIVILLLATVSRTEARSQGTGNMARERLAI